ncbi:MAG: hypothetical protein QOH06_5989 [Acidobacteriota bacterium]|jgi:hypothetical protein|nr:hypothetical protein [Acidobacteriota bacterium]
MTQQKKLKRAIRARSEKTGESYTSARRQVLLAREEPAPPPPTPKPPAKSGISEESVLKKTGHGLDHWFGVLDAFDGAAQGHTAMAAHLHKEHGIPGWHSQGITVAYERARGLREVNQACTGKFQVSVSKTVPATVAEVVAALKSTVWLQGADPGLAQALDAAFTGDKPREVKTKGSDYAWLRFPWDGRTVEIRITGKPKGASVVADNGDLPDPALVEQRRAQWRTALEGLKRHLGV